jgi:OOP family OmpA-OmpF porin
MRRRQFGRVLGMLAAAPQAACVGTPYSLGPAPVAVQERRYALASDVLFDFGSATLRYGAAAALSEILAQIRQVYPYPAIKVEGHTDSIGSPQANLALSQRRAESVRQWLLANGIPPAGITTEGFGETRPVAPNTLNGVDNPAGRQQNRRVEISSTPFQ